MPAWSLNSAWAHCVHADLNIRGDHCHHICDCQGCDVDVSEDVDHDHVVHFGDDQDDNLYAVDDDDDVS